MSGLFSFIGALFSEDVRHNLRVEKQWKDNGRKIVSVTVGWRPDPINKNDGYTEVVNVNGVIEYQKVIRQSGKK